MRKLFPVVLFLVVPVLVQVWGCTCKGDKPTTKSKVSPTPLPEVPVPPPTAGPGGGQTIRRATMREPMEQITKVTAEMGRRAQGKVSMKAPAILLLKLLNQLPAKSSPSTFRTFLDDAKDRAKILQDSENLREDFNSLIDSCQACHRVFSLRSIPPVKRLRVPLKDDAGPSKRK